jgi:multidrug efflux pump subunit AcrB
LNLENEIISRDSLQLNLTGLTRITKNKVPNTLHKQDQQYLKQIEWEYTGSARFGSKYLDETLEDFIPILPLGYSFERRDRSFFSSEAKKQYGLLFLVGALVFMISCIHFESFTTAWSVIVMIPISFIGIFLTFYFFDFPFDQGGYTSFILLSGITVNSIILILSDYKRNLLSDKGEKVEAYTTAFMDKITPILLTIISTIIGLVPFLIHGREEPFWYSLAIGTIGGLLFSLFSLCFIMPAFVLSGKTKST